MKISLEWLSDYIDTAALPAIREYCERMTATGSKVEGYEIAGEEISRVAVGKILSMEKHPDADKLKVCQVDVGGDAPIQIVTAATNVQAGDLVPVALDKATLHSGLKIKEGKLRGALSSGMFCSISEFGLTQGDVPFAPVDGVLIFPEEMCKPGDDVKKVLSLEDTVVEFEITSNRPDCFSVLGLAKETAASFDLPIRLPAPTVKESGGDITEHVSVEVKNQVLCPRYCARMIRNVKIEPSPQWMRTRLRNLGVRPINNIVDITNYVMLEYGQPMHAFDYRHLGGGKIIVRNADEGEKLTTLDGVERTLTQKMLVICDADHPVALAGVMGGENSEIAADTTTVVFESANFMGSSVRTTARDLGMRTESSGRFEKGLDPENVMAALDRACELVTLLGAGEVVSGVIDVRTPAEAPVVLPLDTDKINGFLGTDIPADEMRAILSKLSFDIDGDAVTVPTWRPDVRTMNDLAEEVARIFGYNNIASSHFAGETLVGKRTPMQNYRGMISELCRGAGLYEIMTYSFVSPKTFDLLALSADDPLRNPVVISNPLGENSAVMRTTAIGSMLEVIAHNRSFRNPSVGLFELATVYFPTSPDTLPTEEQQLVIGTCQKGDFYTLKGICECLLDRILPANGVLPLYRFAANGNRPTFHPGRCADIMVGDEVIGSIGQVHPTVADNYGIDSDAYVAVLYAEKLFDRMAGESQYTPIPKYPAVTRDLAFVCDADLEVGVIEKTLAEAGGKKLESIALFDLYMGEQVGKGKKSVAFKLTLRDPEQTLTDETCDKIVKKLLRAMEEKCGVTLRA